MVGRILFNPEERRRWMAEANRGLVSPFWRTVGLTLSLALLGNVLLAPVVHDEVSTDGFVNVISIASGIGLVALFVTRVWFHRFLNDAFLFSFFVWMANFFEYAFHHDAYWVDQLRQCAFYLSFALLSLAGFVAVSVAQEIRETGDDG